MKKCFKFMRARRPLDRTIRKHRDRQERSKNREVLNKASPSVRVPRAKTRLTVYRSPLVLPQLVFFFDRACMCETRRVFQDLVMFWMQMCLGICIFQILIILRLWLELVNDRNDKTGKSCIRLNYSKLNIWVVTYWNFWKIIKIVIEVDSRSQAT